MSIIKDPGRAYIMGFTTMAFAMFLGYKWSPDYLETVSNGYNFLWIVGFGIVVFIMTWLIDGYYKTKNNRKHDVSRSKAEWY